MTGPCGAGVIIKPLETVIPVDFVAVGTANDTASGTLSLALPTGWQAGDLVLAVIGQATVGGNAEGRRPQAAGWVPYQNSRVDSTYDDNELHVLGRRMTGTESSPISFTLAAASGRGAGRTAAFRNVDSDYLIGWDDDTEQDQGDSTTHNPAAVSVAVGDMAVACYGGNGFGGSETISPANGYTYDGRAGHSESNFNCHAEIAHKVATSAGSQSGPTFSHGYTSNGDSIHICLPVAAPVVGTLDAEIMAKSPLVYLKLNETSGTTATDYSGNGRHGTYAGTVTPNSVTAPDGAPAPLFNNGRVTIPTNTAYDRSGGLTIFALIRPTSGSGRRFIVTRGASGPVYSYDFNVDPSTGIINFNSYGQFGSNKSAAVSLIPGATLNRWSAICAQVADATQLTDIKLFLNSVADQSDLETTTANDTTVEGGAIWIGDRLDGGSTEFIGNIARVAIFAGMPNVSRIMAAAMNEGWYTLLTGPTVTINKGASQADPVTGSSVVYDVVFSEAVTGFATGDVNFSSSSTPGVLVGTVAGSGTTYTVTVTGMTGDGNIVATIPSGVAVSSVTGMSNEDSTSTDNVIAFTADPNAILQAKLKIWWDFTDTSAASMVLSGSTITQLKDKCVNELPAGTGAWNFGATVGSGVTSVASVINGKPIGRFNGSSALHGHNPTGLFLNGTIELWVVMKSAEASAGAILCEGTSVAAQAYRLYDLAATDEIQFNYDNLSNVTRFANAQSRTGSAWNLIIATDNGSAVGTKLEVVGVDVGTTGAYTRDGGTWNQIAIGCNDRNTHDGFYTGDIAMILVLSSAADATQRARLANYINNQLGTSWTPS